VNEGQDLDRAVAGFSKYLFSDLLSRASWGIGALEGVSLAGQDIVEQDESAFVPSMIYFGVKKRESVWLRMAGVPRLVADGLATVWENQKLHEPKSYDQIRDWVRALSEESWRQAIPENAQVTPSDMKLIWDNFAGTA
jgi:hypothetical protein